MKHFYSFLAAAVAAMPCMAANEPITEVTGTETLYSNTCTGYNSSFLGAFYDTHENAAKVVFNEDGVVYIKNLLGPDAFNTYVKGSLADSIVTIKLPQCVYAEYDEYAEDSIFTYACVCDLAEGSTEEEPAFNPVENEADKVLTYRLGVDGSLTLLLNNPNLDVLPTRAVGSFTEYEGELQWNYSAYFYQELKPFEGKFNVIPDGAESAAWGYTTADGYAGLLEVAFVDKDVYIAGLCPQAQPASLKGTLADDGTVHFALPQYVGLNIDTNTFTYFTAVEWNEVGESEDEEEEYKFITAYDMAYDATAKSLKATNEKADLLVNSGLKTVWTESWYTGLELKYQDPALNDAAPCNPVIAEVKPYEEYAGYGSVDIDLPAKNVNGNILDTEKMYYNIYFDGELYTFTPELYNNVEEDMTNVPYNFTDLYDFMIFGSVHNVSFFDPAFKTVGVQLHYKADNGTIYSSEIVTSDLASLADTLTGQQPQSVEYFNLQGMSIAKPQSGLYIERAVYAGGKVVTAKRMAR